MRKILLLTRDDWIAPRFDLCREFVLVHLHQHKIIEEPRNLLLGRCSSDKLLDFIIKENCSELICGAIEESHHKFLQWKKITIIDFVFGPWQPLLDLACRQKLKPRTIFHPQKGVFHE